MTGRPLAVVCLSGGMDSAVTAALAAREHRLALLHARYGQLAQEREAVCFRQLAGHFAAEHVLEVDLAPLAAIGGSALTDPRISLREADPVPGVIPSSYVPFRNAHMVCAAVSWAEVLGASAVFVGAVWEDSSGYPDCRPEFYRALEAAVRAGTRAGPALSLVTPVIEWSKARIVAQGRELGVPFEQTWSCYRGAESACGACESCRLRLKGFREAGVVDPVAYAPGVQSVRK